MLIVNKSDLGTAPIQAELADLSRLGPALPRSGLAQPAAGIPTCTEALGRQRDAVRRAIGRRQVLDRQCARAGGGGADRRTHARRRGTAHHDHGPLVPLGSGRGVGHRRCPGGARFRAAGKHRAVGRARLRRDPCSSASIAASRIAVTWRSPAARCAPRCSTERIAARRYESYRRLYRLYEKLAPDRPRCLRRRWCGPPAHEPACRRRRIRARRRPARHGRCATP